MSESTKFSAGDEVKFKGFSGKEIPAFGELLVKRSTYVIDAFIDEDEENEPYYNIKVDNPGFDSTKRKSKNNQPEVVISVFDDEIKAVKKSKAEKKAAKEAAKAAKVEEAAAKTEAEEEAEAPAPKKKAKAKKKAKKEKKADSGKADSELKDLDILGEGEEDQDIVDLVEDTDDICELARELADEQAISAYRLGGVLYHVRISGAYKEAGDQYAGRAGFGKWAEDMLGIKYRKAMYLTKIYARFNKHGIGSEVLAELGWTKCSYLVNVLDDDNVDELIELAKSSTSRDLQDTIRASYTKDGEKKEIVKRVSFRFSLEQDAGVAVAELLEMAEEQLGLEHSNEVFETIITEWAIEHMDVSKVRKLTSKKAETDDAESKAAPAPKKKVAAKKKAVAKKTTSVAKRKTTKKKVVAHAG